MSENFWQRSRGKRRSAPAREKSKKEVEELVAKLSAMGFSENDCRKALKSTNYIEQEAVNILLNNPSKPSNKKSPRKKSPARTKKKSRYLPPPPFAALEEDVEFEKGNFLDCRDKYGMWLEAEVVKLRNDEVLIHYNNWDSKWDEWIPLKDKDKFAPFHRLSVHGKQTKYRMNAKVAIWGPNGLRKWFQGVITDIKHKQVKVTYDESSKNRDCDYWYHYESPDICLIQDFDSYQERLRTQVVDDDPDSNVLPSPNKPPASSSSSSSSSPTPHSSSKTEEWYEGKMIEVLDTAKKWLPAEVLKVKKRKGGGHMLFVSYENWDSSWDEWIDTIKAKGRVRPLGITLKESEKEREIRELHEAFRKDLKERYDFEIQDIKGDGNCQFRCFAHQIYGDDEKHLTVRKMCCNHIGEHKEEFENFICVDFEEYLKKKRTPCEWGDDITLTVLLDIFDKNVEIYHQGRFEEKEEDNSKEKRKYYKPGRVERRERKGKENELPIRLSFHENHYNLVIDPRVTYPLGDAMRYAYDNKYLGVRKMMMMMMMMMMMVDGDKSFPCNVVGKAPFSPFDFRHHLSIFLYS